MPAHHARVSPGTYPKTGRGLRKKKAAVVVIEKKKKKKERPRLTTYGEPHRLTGGRCAGV
jgi:hypothetical protein